MGLRRGLLIVLGFQQLLATHGTDAFAVRAGLAVM